MVEVCILFIGVKFLLNVVSVGVIFFLFYLVFMRVVFIVVVCFGVVVMFLKVI